MSDRTLALLLYLFCTVVYASVAGPRLKGPSGDTHFVYQAESFLARRTDLVRPPPHQNDWAEVHHLTLRDGTQLKGIPLRQSPEKFRTLSGQVRLLNEADIAARQTRHYVSFPPFPAVLLLPFVAVFGARTNDVIFTVVLAGLAPPLLFLFLRRLPGHLLGPPATAQADPPSLHDALWLTLLLAFGSVYFFCSVIGQVWFTAQIVSMVLCALFLHASLSARRPVLSGVLLAGLFLTRPQMAGFGLFFLAELLRRAHPEDRYATSRADLARIRWSLVLRTLVVSALPFVALVLPALLFNRARFGSLFEFGHSYLATMQADNIQRYGLFNYQYLPRNLAAVLTLLPKLLPQPPYVQISYHGVALWVTTPALLTLFSARLTPAIRPFVLWLVATLAPIALAGLLYQNTGYIQFGNRFSLDYFFGVIVLLALLLPGCGKQTLFRVLVLVGVAVNLFGAITFGRAWQFYWNGFFPVP